MGNSGSSHKILNRKPGDENYNIDAEAINTDDTTVEPNLKTPIDINFNKMYIVYHKVNGISQTYVLLMKILDDNLFIYVKDVFNSVVRLAHVVKITGSGSNDKQDIVTYIKYIQISRDFSLISIPEHGRVNVYNLAGLLERDVLEFVDSVGIVLKKSKSGKIRTELMTHNPSNASMDYTELVKNAHLHHVTSMSTQPLDCGTVPYKCVLCKGAFVVICADDNTFRKVVIVDYQTKQVHTIKNINLDINRSVLKLSVNGKHIVIYDNVSKRIYVSNLTEKDASLSGPITFSIQNQAVYSTMCISDDGRFLFYAEENNSVDDRSFDFNIFDIHQKKLYNNERLNSALQLNNVNIRDLKFHLLDYSRYSDVKLSANECDHLYVLVGWNKKLTAAFYWIIQCDVSGYSVHGPSFIDMKINGNIEYIYNNGFVFIYKTSNGITAYDLNRIIPMRLAGIMEAGLKTHLKQLYNDKYAPIRDQYYDTVDIIGADEQKKTYRLNDFMKFLLVMIDKGDGAAKTNVYHLRVTANMDIYRHGTTKSFDIFQGLLTGTMYQESVINDIFVIKGQTDRYNIMRDLMTHMYEFTKVIALGENSQGDIERSAFSNLKAQYIGYILIVLVLKFYAHLLRTYTGAAYSEVSTKKAKDSRFVIKESIARTIKFDIVKTFIENFPPFRDFICRSLDTLLGEEGTCRILKL